MWVSELTQNKSHTHNWNKRNKKKGVVSVKTDEEEEEGEADVQNRRKKAGGNGWRPGKTTSDDGDMSFLPQTSFIFFKFLEMPNFHFLVKMSDI